MSRPTSIIRGIVHDIAVRALALRVPERLAALALVPLVLASFATCADPAGKGKFDTLFEPSGIASLGGGGFLVVEDEPRRALRLVTFAEDGGRPHLLDERVLPPGEGLVSRLGIGALDDLEGAARDRDGRVYVIGSHEDLTERRRGDRQKLLRFSVDGDTMQDAQLVRSLGRDLVDAYPELHEAILEGKKRKREDLSIEGLAFDRARNELLIGLRTPVLDDDAVIARLVNPDAYLAGDAPAAFAGRLLRLDLSKGGVRAMGYDDATDSLLLVSRRDSGKDDAFKLWQLAMDGSGEPERLRLPDGAGSLDSVEGLAVLDDSSGLSPGVLFVRDDGKAVKGRGGEWFVLSREALDMQTQERR